MKYIVTGAAGFIGFYVCKKLLSEGQEVIGIDVVNDYYEVSLKEARLAQLEGQENFTFYKANIADKSAISEIFSQHNDTDYIIHLAAQAGVRYSIENPYAYAESNLLGHITMCEHAAKLPQLKHFIYASSSSVYGGNKKLPFSIDDDVNTPVSIYAATKRADELISHTYSHLHGLPSTGLRFFTVYGPWGRPDMAYFSFSKDILANRPIKVYNEGNMQRDFTYIDDIVTGIMACVDVAPQKTEDNVPHQVFNLGNNNTESLLHFIEVIEDALGKKAIKEFHPMPKGDVLATYADISMSKEKLGFSPTTSIEQGIPQFTAWFKDYYNIG